MNRLIFLFALLAAPAHAATMIDRFSEPFTIVNTTVTVGETTDDGGLFDSRRIALAGMGSAISQDGVLTVTAPTCCVDAFVNWPATGAAERPRNLTHGADAVHLLLREIVGTWAATLIVSDAEGHTASLGYGFDATLFDHQSALPFLFVGYNGTGVDFTQVVFMQLRLRSQTPGALITVEQIRASHSGPKAR